MILERGDYLPREDANRSSRAVLVDGRYQADERLSDLDGKTVDPQLHYSYGGNCKVMAPCYPAGAIL